MKRIFVSLACLWLFSSPALALEPVELLNVSYDPTREFYDEFNQAFAKHWKAEHGQEISVKQSHGGSGKQARAVMDGLKADVVTLALGYDIDVIAEKRGLIAKNWQERLPNHSAPYTSTIVFLVRKGNPKKIHDWADLVKDGVEVITPNPKTSGGARWNYLAAWAYGLQAHGQNENAAQTYMKQLFKHVPVLDTGARGATTTFAQRGIGDVLLTWENEAFLAIKELGKDKFEIVVPSISVRAEPPVSVVDSVVDKRKTRAVAEAYLHYLYSKTGQELAAKYFYRPRDAAVADKFSTVFPHINMVGIEAFGGWEAVQKKHFDDGGLFDQIYSGQ